MRAELYGIRQVHRANGIPLEIHAVAMPNLARVMVTFKKLRPKGSRPKLAITSPVLEAMLSGLSVYDYDHQTVRSILCFAKLGLLRVSEYTDGPCGSCPRVRDIRFIPDIESAQTMVYYFHKSKTNKFRNKERSLSICHCPGPCAVHEVIRMLKWRKTVSGDQYLFRLRNGEVPTARFVNDWIKRLCKAKGFDPRSFSSHGLRAGGVTDLLTAGVPAEIVMVLTRHKSMESMTPYKKPTDEALATLLDRFGAAEVIEATGTPPEMY